MDCYWIAYHSIGNLLRYLYLLNMDVVAAVGTFLGPPGCFQVKYVPLNNKTNFLL